MNRGILNPIQHIYEPPVVADCFEADIEAERAPNETEEFYMVIPPLFWMYIAQTTSIDMSFPAINVNVYMDNNLIWTVELPYQTATSEREFASVMQYRLGQITRQINIEETCIFREYWVHRVRIEPVENVAWWARGLGYIMLWINTQENTQLAALTLIQQPSNRAYYESENNIWEMFKFAQFAWMTIRNQVVVEPIPDDQFSSAEWAFFTQFASTKIPRITITAQNWQNAPEWWRTMSFAWNISQLVIQWKIMDANLTWQTSRWNMLEPYVWEYWLHIYVDRDLVDDYKALNENIAPYVFSDEVIPDPPVYVEPGIYHNAELWLISMSSNWYEWITLADKNLWATEVYNYGDPLTEANCWKFYQRWNNYWFSMNWWYPISSVKVDTTGYGDWNYYTSGTFITASWGVYDSDWSSPSNDSLWYDETLRGPCPSGFHISHAGDRETVDEILGSHISWRILMIPEAWNIDGATWVYQSTWRLANSAQTWSPLPLNSSRPWDARAVNWKGINWQQVDRVSWLPIRPFKDTPVYPDASWELLS